MPSSASSPCYGGPWGRPSARRQERSMEAKPPPQAASALPYLLVGLGNPGRKFAHNRHNAGRLLLEHLAEKHGLPFRERALGAALARGKIGEAPVILARPRSFMNECGRTVRELVAWQKLELGRLLVLTDDLDLPLGKIRFRPWGGAGGHRGLLSIIEHLATDHFPRLRIGVGRPPEDTAARDYVLTDFLPEEKELLAQALSRAVEAVECLLREGIIPAMNRFN